MAERETAAWISSAALQLDCDYLCIQGPPGTGKTYVGSLAAAALIQAGKRVGVLAHSHAAVNNLMAKTLEVIYIYISVCVCMCIHVYTYIYVYIYTYI